MKLLHWTRNSPWMWSNPLLQRNSTRQCSIKSRPYIPTDVPTNDSKYHQLNRDDEFHQCLQNNPIRNGAGLSIDVRVERGGKSVDDADEEKW